MIWEAIAGGVKGLGDTVLGFIKEFHTDPETAIKLEMQVKQAVMDFQRQLLEMEGNDRDSARKREMTVKDKTPAILAYGITAGFFGIVWYMMVNEIPTESQRILDMLLGSLITAWTGVIAYYFGSSAGSAAKHDMINKLTAGGK